MGFLRKLCVLCRWSFFNRKDRKVRKGTGTDKSRLCLLTFPATTMRMSFVQPEKLGFQLSVLDRQAPNRDRP